MRVVDVKRMQMACEAFGRAVSVTRHLRLEWLLAMLACLFGQGLGANPVNAQAGPALALPDFASYEVVTQKKRAFFAYLLPMARAVNEQVLENRRWVVAQLASVRDGEELQGLELWRYRGLLDAYQVEQRDNQPRGLESLELRVNRIPLSLILAQAAYESAWGTSRFARQGNSLFGQWCRDPGCGLVPQRRGRDARHEVQSFPHVWESLVSYVRNLNTHRAYAGFRKLRRLLEQKGKPLSGKTLAGELTAYSARGEDYVAEIQAIILANDLDRYDRAGGVASNPPLTGVPRR